MLCIECETFYELDEGDGKWIECESCSNWFHASCVGIDEDMKQLIQSLCAINAIHSTFSTSIV